MTNREIVMLIKDLRGPALAVKLDELARMPEVFESLNKYMTWALREEKGTLEDEEELAVMMERLLAEQATPTTEPMGLLARKVKRSLLSMYCLEDPLQSAELCRQLMAFAEEGQEAMLLMAAALEQAN